MSSFRSRFAVSTAAVLALAACGGADDAAPAATADQATAATAGGVTVVSPDEAAVTIEAAPDDLVILDIRTPEEFAEGHIEGATLIDFYREDFAEQIAALDRDDPYVLYCRSGNRSQQARSLMAELGFTDVADVDGGIVGWEAAGLPTVAG